MIQVLLKFVSSARSAGLRVSTTELLDCTRQLELVDSVSEEQFRCVLRTNFAKSRRDQAKFDHLYNLFFHELRTDLSPEADSVAPQVAQMVDDLLAENLEDNVLESILEMIAGDPASFLQAAQELESDGNRPAQAMGGNLGQITRRLRILMGFNDIRGLAKQFLDDRRQQIDWQTRRQMSEHVESRLALAQRLLMEEPRPDNFAAIRAHSYEKRLNELGERPFVSLTRKEVEEMRDVIDSLVKKLKDTISRRYATRHRGVLDVKKTLRRASRYHGVPMEIIRKNRPPRKGKVVTLCDVSGSVWSAARFMLNMLYSVQECFTRVRSYIFVAGLAEVTRIFEENDINQAIETVLRETDLEYGAPTDYGASLRQFRREYMDILNKKTTVIIIGDGRSNYCNPEAGILETIREKSRRIIWLNPESEVFWYSGDSEMRTYERIAHEVRPCQNLNQLMEFIQDLVL